MRISLESVYPSFNMLRSVTWNVKAFILTISDVYAVLIHKRLIKEGFILFLGFKLLVGANTVGTELTNINDRFS